MIKRSALVVVAHPVVTARALPERTRTPPCVTFRADVSVILFVNTATIVIDNRIRCFKSDIRMCVGVEILLLNRLKGTGPFTLDLLKNDLLAFFGM